MHPVGCLLVAAILALAIPPACASHAPAETDYVLVYLKSGDRAKEKTAEERAAVQAAHMANIGKLAEEKKLVLAGPFGKENHDPTTRGIFVFDVPTIDEAKALTNTDPAVQAGVLAMDLHTMSTAADLRAAMAAELVLNEAAKREGRERPMSEGIRCYVMLRVDDAAKGDRATRALPPGTVLIAAKVEGKRGLYVLDAKDVAAAAALFPDESALGAHTFDQWWSSTQLVMLGASGKTAAPATR